MEETVEVAKAALFEAICPDERLRGKLRRWLGGDFQKATEGARDELHKLVEEERSAHLFTMNPQLSVRQEHLCSSRVKTIAVRCMIASPKAHLSKGPDGKLLTVNPVSTYQLIRGLIYQNNITSSVLNTYDALAAYYEIAKCRFIDNLSLQVIGRHLLGPQGLLQLFTSDYISRKLYGDENQEALNDLASEDFKQVKERDDLRMQKESLEKSRRRVQDFQRC